MEILVRRSDLARELHLVQGIVERKNSIPILSNVLAEARSGELRISATDLDVSLVCGCPAEVKTEGGVTLSAKKLYEIVRSLPDADVRLTLEKDAWTRIRCERSEFQVAGLPREDFPTLPEARCARAVEIPAATLKSLILRTAFAMTAEDARYYLAGALLVLDKEAIVDGGDRRPPPRVGAARGGPQASPTPCASSCPRKAITELGRLMEELGPDETVSFQPGRHPPRLHRRREHPRLEDGRGAVPRVREGGRGHRATRRSRSPARDSSPRSSA